METFLARIAKLTVSIPDTALPVPAEAPRSITPSAVSENFAVAAGSALAGWAMSGLKAKVLGPEINNEPRSESAPPTQRRLPDLGFKGLGTEGDVDAWKDEESDEETWTKPIRTRQHNIPVSQGMKLPVKHKKSVVEQVVEEEVSKSADDTSAWPELEDWDDDTKDDGWGFDDQLDE